MFVADVFTKLPKGNVRVSVSDSSLGPVVTEVKGIRGGREWVANEIQQALAYDPDGSVRVRWEEVDIPASLRRRNVGRRYSGPSRTSAQRNCLAGAATR